MGLGLATAKDLVEAHSADQFAVDPGIVITENPGEKQAINGKRYQIGATIINTRQPVHE